MSYSIKKIQEIAYRLLDRFSVASPPIDVLFIAKKLGIEVKEGYFGENVSGILFYKNDYPIIGCQKNQDEKRIRFTIAHELGHYLLKHHREGFFVDKPESQFKVLFRDEKSSTGEVQQEREANAFAAALLMPEYMIKEEILKLNPVLELSDGDDNLIIDLADKFKVSQTAMMFRLMNLKIFSSY